MTEKFRYVRGLGLVAVDVDGGGITPIEVTTLGIERGEPRPLGDEKLELVAWPYPYRCQACGGARMSYSAWDREYICECGEGHREVPTTHINRWAPPPTYPRDRCDDIPDSLNPDSLQYAPPWPLGALEE